MPPPHLWIHVVKLGPAGIVAALVYFGKAPLVSRIDVESSGFGGGYHNVEHWYGLFGRTDWSQGTAIFWAVVAFVVIGVITYLVTGKAVGNEGAGS